MTRKIIENFGGRIWLDTTVTKGARFFFTLPMPEESMTPELLEPFGAPDDQHAAALPPAPDPTPELEADENRQDEETDGRLR